MSAQESKKRPAAKGGKGGKAGARTSKTDHVLNLLGGGLTAPAQEESQPAQAAPASSPAPAPQAPAQETAPPPVPAQTPPPASPGLTAPATPSLPILEVARNNNQRLADTICSALEQALAEEEGPQAPAAPAEAAPVKQEAEPTPEPALQEPAPEPEPVPQEPTPEPEPKPVKPAPEPEAPPAPAPKQEEPAAPAVSNPVEAKPAPAQEPEEEDSPILPGNALYLNVMELLVDEAMARYGNATGLCPCARCRADAKALTLSRLPAKYVVLPAPAMPPMISLYREEFSSDVLAQILFSCNQVKENPRHPQG